MDGIPPSSSVRRRNPGVGRFCFALVVLALFAALGARSSATAAVALFAIVLALGWIVAATLLTRWCDARALVLEPIDVSGVSRALMPFDIDLTLGNRRRRLPVLFLTVELDTAIAGDPLPSPPEFLGQIDPGERAIFRWQMVIRRRGRHRIVGVRAWNAFPGALFTHEYRFPVDVPIAVLPATYTLDSQARNLLLGRRHGTARTGANPIAISEFIGVRDYRPGDNPRTIDFKMSIRRPEYPIELTVREFEDPSEDDVSVILDTVVEPHLDEEQRLLALYRHEKSIPFTVAICRLFLDQRKRVRVKAVGGDGQRLDLLLAKQADLFRLESWCADLTPARDRAAVWQMVVSAQRTNATVLYVSLQDAFLERQHRRLAVVTVPPDWQTALVREVVVGAGEA